MLSSVIEALGLIANISVESQVLDLLLVFFAFVSGYDLCSLTVPWLTYLSFCRLLHVKVLYHTPKSSLSHWDDERGAHILSVGDLPFFVSSFTFKILIKLLEGISGGLHEIEY